MLTRRALLASTAAIFVLGALMPRMLLAADVTKEAAAFVSKLADHTIAILKDKSLGKDGRVHALGDVFLDGFDVQAIGRFVLGRYWTGASQPERDEYLGVFKDFVVQTYAIRFNSYAGEVFKVVGTAADGDNGALVTSNIGSPGEDPARVEWRVRQEPAGYKIVDVIVEGVSLAITQRSEFAAVLQANAGSVAKLTATLRDKINQLKTKS
jgi:phospholipid transport system substrate-binding protein